MQSLRFAQARMALVIQPESVRHGGLKKKERA